MLLAMLLTSFNLMCSHVLVPYINMWWFHLRKWWCLGKGSQWPPDWRHYMSGLLICPISTTAWSETYHFMISRSREFTFVEVFKRNLQDIFTIVLWVNVVLLLTDRGHYLCLAETLTRPSYKAIFTVKKFKFSDSCLEFFYQFMGSGTMNLFIRRYKNADVEDIDILSGSGDKQIWQR